MYPTNSQSKVDPLETATVAEGTDNTLDKNDNPEDDKNFKSQEDIDIQNALTDLLHVCRDEDRFVRDVQLRVWKRLEYYWNNILDIFLDPISRDWRVPDWEALEETGEIPPRLINIYRPYGEAIVAALSVTVPAIIYHPDNADNPDDIETAEAYRHINDLIASHDNDTMLFIKAIVIMFNQGTVFGYNYYHADPRYGVYEKPHVEFKDISIYEVECPECGMPLDAGAQGKQEQNYTCPQCGYQGPGEVNLSSERLPQIVGYDKTPKGTICRELYSGLNIKIPAYAKDQPNCGYLLLEFFQSTAMLRSIFQDHLNGIEIESRFDNTWEGFSKMPVQYLGMSPENASNVSCVWFRPWMFYQLGNNKIEVIRSLKKKYPNGCYAIFINDTFMEAVDENMDDHWTFSKNPLSTSIYARPLGENLATIQDIRANLVEIELQTAEYGIPETYVDEKVVDLDKYSQSRAQPGMVTPAKPRAGKSLGDAFYTTKAATLSQEIDPLRQHIDQDAQFVTGAYPSIYGGSIQGGSKTLGEYSQSRALALQRIGIVWKIVCDFWCGLSTRSAVEFANVLKELNQDVRYTKREGKNFINNWIKQSSLNGKIGRVEPEASEQLPVSWAQKKDLIFQLFQSRNDTIHEVLTDPNNADLVKSVIGLSELYIPGSEDRERQLKEFKMLSQGIDVPTKPMVDKDIVHISVLTALLEGPLGESLDDHAMQVCMKHLQEHQQNMQKNQQDPPEVQVEKLKQQGSMQREQVGVQRDQMVAAATKDKDVTLQTMKDATSLETARIAAAKQAEDDLAEAREEGIALAKDFMGMAQKAVKGLGGNGSNPKAGSAPGA